MGGLRVDYADETPRSVQLLRVATHSSLSATPMGLLEVRSGEVSVPDVAKQIITALEAAKADLIAYLRMKITVEDWHGVADAAMDLRELDAALAVWRSL